MASKPPVRPAATGPPRCSATGSANFAWTPVCGLWFVVFGLGFGVWGLPRRTDREFKNRHVNLERSKIIARFPLSDYEKVGNNVSFVPMPGTHSCL